MKMRGLVTRSQNPQSEIRNPQFLGLICVMVFALCSLLLAPCFSVQAQQPTKVPRIGYLTGTSLSTNAARNEAFRQGLRELGYVEGKNIVIEWRSAEGKLDRLHDLATDLVRLKVDVLVSGGGNSATRALKQATTLIPIVMMFGSDPVAAGIVSSLARPGGIVTGLTSITGDLSGKRLELLTETILKLSRVAVLYDPGDPAKIAEFKETEVAARGLGVQIQSLEVRSTHEIESVFKSATSWKTNALIVLQTVITSGNHNQIVELATKNRLPAMFSESQFIETGGLMSYGPSYNDLSRRAAVYVDKILKGAKPADLPVEQPMKFEFVINLKAAKQIGLTIPPNVLVRADRVIR
jgi:putative tryptophan/tyrosine transport system substrate-binding protein